MRYKDFDAMFAQETNNDAYGHIKIFGNVIDFAKDIPAIYMLEHMRGANYSAEYIFKMAVNLFGAETLEELSTHKGFGIKIIREMVNYAFAVINGEDEPDGDDGEELMEDDFGKVAKKAKN